MPPQRTHARKGVFLVMQQNIPNMLLLQLTVEGRLLFFVSLGMLLEKICRVLLPSLKPSTGKHAPWHYKRLGVTNCYPHRITPLALIIPQEIIAPQALRFRNL